MKKILFIIAILTVSCRPVTYVIVLEPSEQKEVVQEYAHDHNCCGNHTCAVYHFDGRQCRTCLPCPSPVMPTLNGTGYIIDPDRGKGTGIINIPNLDSDIQIFFDSISKLP